MPDRTGEIPVDEHLRAFHLSEVEFNHALSDYMKGRPMDPKREELERAVIETGLIHIKHVMHGPGQDAHWAALRALRDYLAQPVWEELGPKGIRRTTRVETIWFDSPATRDRVLRLLNESEKPDRSF